RDFAALLTDPNFGRFKKSNVALLTDAEATTNRIKSEIEHIREVAGPEDLVVIYISTHGSPRDPSSLDVNYIVTHDTNPDRLWATSLPMVDVVRDANKMIRAQRMVTFLDTCFSGSATKAGTFLGGATVVASNSSSDRTDGSKAINFDRGVSQKMISQPGSGIGRVIITASQPTESSWESDKLQNGVFTYFLIQALKQNKGMTPIGGVFNFLSDQVSQRVREEKKSPQRPMMEPPETKLDICIGIQSQSNKEGIK
ncbi:MAG: caspase family protein, partial [Blastocatellia bacterium]